MSVGFDVAPNLLQVKAKLCEVLDNSHINWYGLRPNDYASIVFNINLLVPWMLSNLVNSESRGWVCVQDALNELFALRGHERRDAVLSIQNLLVEQVGVWVFKGQISAHHRKQNDPT